MLPVYQAFRGEITGSETMRLVGVIGDILVKVGFQFRELTIGILINKDLLKLINGSSSVMLIPCSMSIKYFEFLI